MLSILTICTVIIILNVLDSVRKSLDIIKCADFYHGMLNANEQRTVTEETSLR